ncbi:MAG: DUF362 domain-containing protein [Candidatus Aenigmarchaeota archaeon]|nr:DUF362 domain-containing protein [Candidatus Aenigmarchaeota archaeon]
MKRKMQTDKMMVKSSGLEGKTGNQIAEHLRKVIGVAQMKGQASYPKKSPFDPPKKYPELTARFSPDKSNKAYPLVRELFREMGLDRENYGKKSWNPLGEVISPGGKVVIKPNWVLDKSEHSLDALITHTSVIRAVIDYAWIACGPSGRIDLIESPIQSTDWENLMKVTQAREMVSALKERGVNIHLQDIRTETFVEKEVLNILGWKFKIFYRKKLSGTEKGYTQVNLESESSFHEVRSKAHLFRGIQQWTNKEATLAHDEKNHIYSIPNELLEADVFINLPKLKTHRKAGVTLALKNLVGTVNNKDWLPHYIQGTPQKGGDEAPSVRPLHIKLIDALSIVPLSKTFGFSIRPPGIEKIWRKKIESDLHGLKNVRQANWYGGDTVWRMVYDLNKILIHADKNGSLKPAPQRKYFALVDGIVAGEGFGPLNSLPKKTGVILGGFDPLLVDFVGTRVMGFDEEKIKTLSNAGKQGKYAFGESDFSAVELKSKSKRWKGLLESPKNAFHFKPAPGWKGHIEKEVSG